MEIKQFMTMVVGIVIGVMLVATAVVPVVNSLGGNTELPPPMDNSNSSFGITYQKMDLENLDGEMIITNNGTTVSVGDYNATISNKDLWFATDKFVIETVNTGIGRSYIFIAETGVGTYINNTTVTVNETETTISYADAGGNSATQSFNELKWIMYPSDDGNYIELTPNYVYAETNTFLTNLDQILAYNTGQYGTTTANYPYISDGVVYTSSTTTTPVEDCVSTTDENGYIKMGTITIDGNVLQRSIFIPKTVEITYDGYDYSPLKTIANIVPILLMVGIALTVVGSVIYKRL